MLKRGFLNYFCRYSSTKTLNQNVSFEPVFSFPHIKYIAIINRLKVYHLYGSGITVPSCGLLEMFGMVPDNVFLAATYIGTFFCIYDEAHTIYRANDFLYRYKRWRLTLIG